MGKILAIDPGTSKMGVAISDLTRTLARPLAVWSTADFWGKMAELTASEEVEEVVIGIPRGLKNDTAQTEWAREFAAQVAEKMNLPVHCRNEIFTTKIAQAQRSHLKKSERREADDAQAAAVLLQDFLDSRAK